MQLDLPFSNRSRNHRHRRVLLTAIASANALLISDFSVGQTAPTATISWVGANPGSWGIASNWSSNALPLNTDVAFLDNAQVILDDPNLSATAFEVNLAHTSGFTGQLTVSAGTLSIIRDIRMGNQPNEVGDPLNPGIGIVTQSGGVVTMGGWLNVGNGGSGTITGASAGTYTMSAGSLTVATSSAGNELTVGNGLGVTGQFDQTGGNVESKGLVVIGRNGGSGTYNLSGAANPTLKATGDIRLGGDSGGAAGFGIFNQSSGSVSTATSVNVGLGGAGTYNLSGGTLTVAAVLAVGNGETGVSGTGYFHQTGGRVDITQNLTVGRYNATPARGGTGTYDLSGGSLNITSATGSMCVGGNGNVQSVGTMLVSNAPITLSGGNVNVGFGNATTASFTAGTLIMGTGASLAVPGTGAVMAVGNNLAVGYVELDKNASINNSSGTFEVGRNSGTGQLVMNDTSSLTTTQLNISNQGNSAGIGTVTVNNGTLNFGFIQFGTLGTAVSKQVNLVNGVMSGGSINMSNMSGSATPLRVFNMTGGSLTLTGTSSLGTNTSGGSTVFQMSAGSASLGSFNVASGAQLKLLGGTATLNGGTIGASGLFESAISINIPNQLAFGTATLQTDPAATVSLNTVLFPASRAMTKTGTGILTFNGPFTFTGASVGTINATDGTTNINANGTSALAINANGGVTNLNAQQTIKSLTVGAGGTAVLKTAGTTAHGVTNFSIAGNTVPTGTLDIGRNALAIDYTAGNSPFPNVKAQVISGFTNGNFNGPGIRSSSASFSGAHPTAVGYAEASAVGLTSGFGGVTTDADTVIVRYTLAGDANLDGQVGPLDFQALAANFNQTGGIWSGGDFNYDGAVNLLDFNLLASNYGAPLPSSALGTLVPEPVAASILFAVAAVSARRRRQMLV